MPDFRINKKLLLMKIHYFVGIGGYAPFSPFLPIIAKQRGYSAFIVGLIAMLQPLPGLFIRPLVGAITDKYKCRRSVLIGSAIFSFIMIYLLSIIPGKISKEMDDLDVIKSPLFWLFFGTVSILNSNGTVKSVLEDTICMSLLGEDKEKYGKQRLWGSVGWSLLAIVSGAFVDWYSEGQEYKNYNPCFIISMICFFLDILIVIKIEVKQESDTTVVASDVKKIFTEGKVLAFLLWVVFFGFFMSFIWNFVFWYFEDLANDYHPEMKPWMKTLQGLALIIQCFMGEVPFFFLSGFILKHVDHMRVFSVMFFTFTFIFSMYSFIENPLWALTIEAFNGIVYAITYSAAISYAAVVTPAGAEGTLQGVVGTALHGIGAPVGSLVGGYMIKHIGSITSFKLLSVIAAITFITQIVVNHLINRTSKREDIKDEYSAVQTTDDFEKNKTVC